MDEFDKELAVANLKWEYLEELRANSGEEMIRAVIAITRLSWGLSEEELRGAREWACTIHNV